MTAALSVEDRALPLPELPEMDGEIGPLAFPLPAPVHASPEVLGGDLRIVAGRAGLDLLGPESPVMAQLRVPGADLVAETVTPLGLERTLRGAMGTIVERATVPFTGGVAFFEWRGNSQPGITWQLPVSGAATEPVRWRATARAWTAVRGVRQLLFVASTPSSFQVRDTEAGGLEVHMAPDLAGDHLLLAVARLDPGERRMPRHLRRPGIVVRGREARVRQLLDDRLQVEVAGPTPTDSLAWDVLALAVRDADPGAGLTSWEDVAAAEASLATGEVTAVRRRVVAAFGGPGPVSLPAAAALARYLAWTGDRSVVGVWDRLPDDPAMTDGDPPDGQLVTATRAALGQCARDLGRSLPEPWRGGAAPTRARGDGLLSALSALVAGGEAAGEPVGRVDSVGRVLRWVRRLGLAPDALRGRLTWGPAVRPGGWRRVRIRNLRVGGTTVGLGYTTEGDTTRFRLEPERGGTPLTVVLEPVLVGGEVRSVRVDGDPAELEIGPDLAEKGWRVPLQLVLDRPRSLEVEMAPENH